MAFFIDDIRGSGPKLTDEMIAQAESTLGRRLPAAYIAILRERNGGIPMRRCFRTNTRTSWADDHIEISMLLGLGFERGIDGVLGSAYLVQEWGYPNIGIVICTTPSGGHDTVMLDYRECGTEGEPRVVYIDDDGSILFLSVDFAAFSEALSDCSMF